MSVEIAEDAGPDLQGSCRASKTASNYNIALRRLGCSAGCAQLCAIGSVQACIRGAHGAKHVDMGLPPA
jgi:hypothetical protein